MATKTAKDLDAKLLNAAHQNHKKIKVFDTETTGLSKDHEIIQFSGITIDAETWEELDREDFFINIGYPLPTKITEITGITDEILQAEGISREEAFNRISKFFGDEIVMGYNVAFDVNKVSHLYSQVQGMDWIPSGIIDLYKIVKSKCPKNMTENQKLMTMTTYFGLDDGITFHRAIDDVIATARLAHFLYDTYINETAAVADNVQNVDVTNQTPIQSLVDAMNQPSQPIRHTIRPRIPVTGTYPVNVTNISRWTKSENMDRLYIDFDTTDSFGMPLKGKIYYDYVDNTFKETDSQMISLINMKSLEIQVFDKILLSGVYTYSDYKNAS